MKCMQREDGAEEKEVIVLDPIVVTELPFADL
jgi:hypothetical protein